MSIIFLSHACSDENGWDGYEGSRPGDQTGTEVRVDRYEDVQRAIGFTFVLRYKDPKLAEAHAIRCQQAADNPAFGYSQPHRMTGANAILQTVDPSKVKGQYELDCSSLQSMTARVTLMSAGYDPGPITGAEVTATMRDVFLRSGHFNDVTSQVNLSTGAGLRRGDILIKPGVHTANVSEIREDAPAQVQAKADGVLVYGATVNVSLLNVRTGPGSEYPIYQPYPLLGYGNQIDICGTAADKTGVQWYYIRIAGKHYAYVAARYIDNPVTAKKELKIGAAVRFSGSYIYASSYKNARKVAVNGGKAVSVTGTITAYSDQVYRWHFKGGGIEGWAEEKDLSVL